jgi:hypothetical protein
VDEELPRSSKNDGIIGWGELEMVILSLLAGYNREESISKPYVDNCVPMLGTSMFYESWGRFDRGNNPSVRQYKIVEF